MNGTTNAAHRWGDAAIRAGRCVTDHAVNALWRTLNYLCAAQLYLADNVTLDRPLLPDDVKETPKGHWGVCPPVNAILAHLASITPYRPRNTELIVLHGAGHAGASAIAYAYLAGQLQTNEDEHPWSMKTLNAVVTEFPNPHTFGSEVTPLIPGVRYMGGQLGPALPVAQGMVLDAPDRLVVPLVGDGECETGPTSAAWLGRRALIGTGDHGIVLPVVLLNGLRMGGPSLLAGLRPADVVAYFAGMGYRPFLDDGASTTALRQTFSAALDAARPLGSDTPQPVIVLTLPKGATGPERVGNRQILGTARVHKTPLVDPRRDPAEFAALDAWLTSYRPGELLTSTGSPSDLVREALPKPVRTQCTKPTATPRPPSRHVYNPNLVIRERGHAGGFRVFSPDELTSNRIDLTEDDGTPAWVVEVLNEELCHTWLQGYTETGRDAILVTYEAFASINVSLLAQHLKHRRLQSRDGLDRPSINYVVTSLGWHNTYTHQNPGLVGALLDLADPTVHIYYPADRARAAATLADMLASRDQTNVLVFDKHVSALHPSAASRTERSQGIATWPHLSDSGSPHIVLASVGDLAAGQLSAAANLLRRDRPGLRLRYVHIHDLTVLGSSTNRDAGLDPSAFTEVFGSDIPVLIATTGLPGDARSLLGERADSDRFQVVGYRDPGRPTSNTGLLEHSAMTVDELARTALEHAKEAIDGR